MKNIFGKTAVTLGLSAILAGGVWGFREMERNSRTPLTWNENEITEQVGIISLPMLYGPSKICREAWTLDLDKDNDVDALMYEGLIFRYSREKKDELKSREYQFEYSAKEMTPELRNLANEVVKAQQDFARKYLSENKGLKD